MWFVSLIVRSIVFATVDDVAASAAAAVADDVCDEDHQEGEQQRAGAVLVGLLGGQRRTVLARQRNLLVDDWPTQHGADLLRRNLQTQ